MAKILIGRRLDKNTDSVTVVSGLVPEAYDSIALAYDSPPNQDDVVQAVYRLGGPGGTVVATLTLTYNVNRNISSVTRT